MIRSSTSRSARRVWSFLAALACVFVMQGSGCDDGDDITIIGGGSTLIESLFPGTAIAENNLGNDGQSLSDAELILNQGYVVFRNASNGTAILLYTDRAERLWAHYFDGTGFTPPVEIRGVNQLDFDDDLGQTSEGFGGSDDQHETWRSYQVLFLNTGGHSNGNAAARNGDALIIWNKEDFDLPSGADPDSDNNYRLYGTYFDRSLAGTPASGDVRYGFDTTATTIDFDNQTPGGDDDNVTACGFVSDSLVASHYYPAHGSTVGDGSAGDEMILEEPTLSGDPTTFVSIVWRKGLMAAGSMVASRYHQVSFDLTAATNDIPAEPSLGAGVLPLPGGVTIPDANEVDGAFEPTGGFVVHNGDMIWRSDTSSNPGLFLTRFGAGVMPATIELGNTITSGETPELPAKTDVYGADHGGLVALYAIFEAANSVHVAKSDLDAALSRETSNISALAGGLNFFGGTRINRTADWIMGAWIEGVAGGGDQAFARAIQTRGPGDPARTLANSLSAIVQAPNASPTTGVEYLVLQSEVANGMQLASCGVQSDRNRINFAFQQPNPADPSNQRLFHNGVIFTADATGSAPPTAVPAAGASEGLVDEHDTNYDFLDDDLRPVLTDLGTSSGAPVIYYLRNDNNPTDASATGAFTEIRVFGAPGVTGGLPTLIGTDGALSDNTINETMFDTSEGPIDELTDAEEGTSNFLRVQTVPLNANVGSSPNHSGNMVHVFFQEARGAGNSLWALKSRALVKASFNAAVPAGFGAAHSPAAPTSAPVTLDGTGTNPAWVHPTFHDDAQDVGVLGNMFVVQGSTVGVFFHSDTHFWYQENDGSGWYTDAGLGDAQQIDNQFGSDIFPGQDQMGYAFPSFSRSTCDNRIGTIACFVRNMPGDDLHVRRLFVRVIE